MTLWIVLGVVALLLGFLGYLIWPWAGLGISEQLPVADQPGKFRVRFGSIAANLLRKKASANHHFVLAGVIHVADYDLTPAQFCHELYHVLREKQLGWRHVWRYLTSKAFRVQEEAAAEVFQKGWRDNDDILDTLLYLSQYGRGKA